MKKISVVLIILCISCSVFAGNSFNAGYGLSLKGTTEGSTDIEASLIYRPFRFAVLNPYVRAEYGLRIQGKGAGLSGTDLKASLCLELFRTMKNPLVFTMVNPGPWSPCLSLGVSTDFSGKEFVAEISPFRVLDKDFIYEWFAVSCNFDLFGINEWQVVFLRLTSLF